jgi:hypothetical protein
VDRNHAPLLFPTVHAHDWPRRPCTHTPPHPKDKHSTEVGRSCITLHHVIISYRSEFHNITSSIIMMNAHHDDDHHNEHHHHDQHHDEHHHDDHPHDHHHDVIIMVVEYHIITSITSRSPHQTLHIIYDVTSHHIIRCGTFQLALWPND